MLMVLAGLFLGVVLGLFLPVNIPIIYAKYMSVAFLAAFDSILGATRSVIAGNYTHKLFLSGFISNTLLATLLTMLGDRLGVDLYLAAIVTFGVRIFQDLTIIRHLLFEQRKVIHKDDPPVLRNITMQ